MLPVTYFTPTDSWVNSPGYVDGTADFARPITARCLECHSTYFQAADTANRNENRFVRDNFILGIACVRCHGPATDHIAFHRENPSAAEAHHIVHPGNLSSDESIAICAQCHSGIGIPRQPSFTYLPGRELSEYLELNTGPEAHQAGVHTANQYARLKLSECFQQSDSMTCATCHDPHTHEHGDEQRFARRCLTCHQTENCPPVSRAPTELVDRCVTCHMREEAFADITVVAEGQHRTPRMHDHKIRVWQEHSRDLLQQWGIR